MSCSKRRRLIASPDWSNIEFDLFETVLKTMSYVDVLSVQAVCCSWRSIAKAYISSSFLKKPLVFALFPKNGKVYLSCSDSEKLPVFAPFADNGRVDEDVSCFGSSLGWVLVSGSNTNLFMVSLFTPLHVKLPPLSTLPCFDHNNKFRRDRWISKFILSCDPTSSGEYVVVVLYGRTSHRLAYSMHGDVTRWTTLEEGTYDSYNDIIWYRDHLYAISQDFKLQVWEFKDPTPVKKTMTIDLSLVNNIEELEASRADLYSHQAYLVESLGEILLIVRIIGNNVSILDGAVVGEEDMVDDEELSHVDCEYRTMKFYVYKLDLEENKWVKVESLGDQMLFLGLNQSVSRSAQDFQQHKRNSIYFTDDLWDMHLWCELIAGHDMGVYELDNGNITSLRSGDVDFEPACWIVHNPGTIR